jgi:hypothetical protein
MYAWVDPEGERENKSSYKFPHHEVDSDGMPGAANTRACIAAIAVLNGARGGADIPDDDRKGVWDHVAKHLRDAGEEPPELKSGETFVQQASRVHGDAEKLISRCRDIVEMRKAKGKDLGGESKSEMYEVRDRLANAVKAIDEMLEEGDYEQEFADAIAKMKLKEFE